PAREILAGGVGATAATHGDTQIYLEVGKRFSTVCDGFDDLALCDRATYTNEHENNYYLESDEKQRSIQTYMKKNCKRPRASRFILVRGVHKAPVIYACEN